MNYDELKLLDLDSSKPNMAAFAHTQFGDKVSDMTFYPREKGCATFTKTGEWFLWHWFDYTNLKWKETHILREESHKLHIEALEII